MENSCYHNVRWAKSSNPEVLNTTSGITTGNLAHINRLGTLTFYYTNCRSLYGKMDTLRALTASWNIDIIVLREIWLSSQIEDSELTLSGCSLLRRDRRIGVHGGVAAFMKSTFSHETVADSISWDDQLEVLAFKIYGPMEIQLDIIVVYSSPSQSFNLDGILIERFQEFSRASSMILAGDFNAPNINWKDVQSWIIIWREVAIL